MLKVRDNLKSAHIPPPSPQGSNTPQTLPQLIEREKELQLLSSLVADARADKGSIALVYGEAGIGKTSLIQAFQRRFGADIKFLVGGNDPLTTPRPFGPIFDMAPLLSASVSTLLRSGASRSQLFDAFFAEFSQLSAPVVLVIEDAHWADSATLDFLKFIGRRIISLRCLIVLTYRDGEINADHPLSVPLGEFPQARVHRFALAPLTHEGVAQCITDSGIDIDRLYSLTNGNPFFVSEILKGTTEQSTTFPASIADAVSARLAYLPAVERNFIETLCVAPKAISADLIRKAIGDDAIESTLACLGKGILTQDENGDFRFRHELMRLAILERTPADSRIRSHRKFFEALSPLNDTASIDLQVHHADGAKMPEEVLRVAPMAAGEAARLSAHAEAFAHFSIALKYIDSASPETAASIWENWAGSACVSTSMGDQIIDGRRQAARLWIEVGHADKAAQNLRWLSRLHWYRCEPVLAESVAEDAIALMEQAESDSQTALAFSFRAQLHMLRLEMNEAIACGERALEIAHRCDSLEAEIHALNTVGTAECFQNKPAGIARIQESLALAENASYGEYVSRDADIARSYLNLADHATEFRNFELANAVISKGAKRCAEIDFQAWVCQLNARKARTLLDQGKFVEAEAIAASVLKSEFLTPQILLTPSLVLARILSRQGGAKAGEALIRCLKLGQQADDTGFIISCRLALIEHAWMNDDRETATDHLLALRAIDQRKFHIWNEAERIRWEQTINGSADTANILSVKLLGAQFSSNSIQAAEALMYAHLPFDAALVLLQGAEKAPAEFLQQAAIILNEIEATAAINKCYRLAEDFNVTKSMPPKKRGQYNASKDHPLNLTKREVGILEFLIEGATNKEIAQKIHRSSRTVDQHVSSILKKLNVSNRVEAILRVKDEPWIL